MPITTAHRYQDGICLGELALDEWKPMAGDRSHFAWVELTEPTRLDLEWVAACFGLHPLMIEAGLDLEQPPRLDVLGNQLLVNARAARLEHDHIVYSGIAFFVSRHHIVVVRGHDEGVERLRARLEAAPGLLAQGVDYVLHAMLDQIVDGYVPLFEMAEDDVLEMERKSFYSFLEREEIGRIFGLRCQLTRFQRTLAPMSEVTRKLARGHYPCISGEARPYFDDVLDHVRRVQGMTDGLLQILISAFEFASLLEQQRQGTITRQLAAWAAILAVPTAIAGLYGMNFPNLPGTRSDWGYLALLGVVSVLCGLLFVRFRRLRWL